MGHKGRFPSRLSGCCRFGQETIAGTHGNGRDAPTPDIRQAGQFAEIRAVLINVCSSRLCSSGLLAHFFANQVDGYSGHPAFRRPSSM